MNRSFGIVLWIVGLVVVILVPAAISVRAIDEQPDRDAATAEGLVERLGHEDFQEREAAHRDLAELGASARAALEAGTRSEDPEIRWRCKRLLRQLDERSGGEQREEPGPRTGSRRDDGPGSRERSPARDLPRDLLGRPFEDRLPVDPRVLLRLDASQFGGLDLPRSLLEDHDLARLLEDLDVQNERIREHFERMREWMRRADRGVLPPGGSSVASSIQISVQDGEETIEFESGPDGAVAHVTRNEGGAAKTETFRAEDVESFRESFPDLADRLGLDRIAAAFGAGGFRFRFGPERAPFTLDPGSPPAPGAPRKRLGILCGDVPRVLRLHLDLEADLGILVEEVETGSAAERAGLRPYDILLRVNGSRVTKPDDIRARLATMRIGDELELELVRAGERRTLRGRLE